MMLVPSDQFTPQSEISSSRDEKIMLQFEDTTKIDRIQVATGFERIIAVGKEPVEGFNYAAL